MGDAGTTGYDLAEYAFTRPVELDADDALVRPVVIVGGGPAGLALAADLGLRGVPVVVVDQDARSGAAGIASRGIAHAKRTLEIFDRLGIADRIREKGVSWNEVFVYEGLEELYRFTIQPEPNQKWPAFLNLQQFYVEELLAERIAGIEGVELRWQSRVTGVEQDDDVVTLLVSTPVGEYRLRATWVIACDGANSSMQGYLGIATPTALFEDLWAVTDVRVDLGDLQRRFWLDYPHLERGAAVMHCMADGIVRCDWQIIQLDPEVELTVGRVRERLASFLGAGVEFEIVTMGRFRFKRRLIERFTWGRVIFLGDAAHEVPPFGARGGNSAIHDAENLAWKLAAVLAGNATPELLRTYDLERGAAALENAFYACQSASFITPKTRAERLFRAAVMTLARDHEPARAFVNTGRPSLPVRYAATPLNVADADRFDAGVLPGEAAFSALVDEGGRPAYLLDRWRGNFTALHFTNEWDERAARPASVAGFPLDHVVVTRRDGLEAGVVPVLVDRTGDLFERYDARDGASYVLRPDAHVAGRRRRVGPDAAGEIVLQALRQADPAGPAQDGRR